MSNDFGGVRSARTVTPPDEMHENDVFKYGRVVGVDEQSQTAATVAELDAIGRALPQENDPDRRETLMKRQAFLFKALHPEPEQRQQQTQQNKGFWS